MRYRFSRLSFHSWRDHSPASESPRKLTLSPFELVFIVVLVVVGVIYHWNPFRWSNAYIGETQYGDAEFWWNGAIHLSQGIFANNPGRGYRPGFFAVAGSAIAVLGTNFVVFHELLLLWFLAACSGLFLALRTFLGPMAAACAISLIAFNPFHAAWLSTSTTDGLGLVFHLFALLCLFRAFDQKPSRGAIGWLSGFGLLFSAATLTRPIVTPFIGATVILIVVIYSGSLKRNIAAATGVCVAFLLPSLAWMAFQRATVGQWSVSTNDASAFYAASDPAIQVWNNEMYDDVQKTLTERLGKRKLTDAEYNQEFWRRTGLNYRRFWRYHFQRLPYHFREMALFGPQTAEKGGIRYRQWFLGVLLGAYLLWFLWQRDWKRASVSGVLLWLSRFQPAASGIATGLGAAWALVAPWFRPGSLTLFWLSIYWLIGGVALALIGGTFWSGSVVATTINALGYRVGSQVFFASEVLEIAFVISLLGKLSPELWIFQRRSRRAAIVVVAAFSALMIGTAGIELAGAGIVASRWYARKHKAPVPFPLMTPVRDAFLQVFPKAKLPVETVSAGQLFHDLDWWENAVCTGMTSEFVWNLDGQDRGMVLFYQQRARKPISMSPNRLILEMPSEVRERDWAMLQGAFVVTRVKDLPAKGNMAYYQTESALRGFVPLDLAQRSFDLSRARWFPLRLYASELQANGLLGITGGEVEWHWDPELRPYLRRFRVKSVTHEMGDGRVHLTIELSRIRGPRRFSFLWEPAGGGSPAPAVRVNVEPEAAHCFSAPRNLNAPWPRRVECGPFPGNTKRTEVVLENVPKDGLWVYEMSLDAEDLMVPEQFVGPEDLRPPEESEE